MRAIVFDRYGEPDVMSLRDVPIPEPQDGEVLIRVGYAGVNPADAKVRAGHTHRYREVEFPFVTGMDAAGVVERAGPNVNEFRQGDRVITWSAADWKTWGSYAEFIRVSARNVSPMPKSLNFAQNVRHSFIVCPSVTRRRGAGHDTAEAVEPKGTEQRCQPRLRDFS
jgi:NADPH:quinone reductase-like Zn-dependent oxidoreductase